MALSYSDLGAEAAGGDWQTRVTQGLLQLVSNTPSKIEALPPASTDVSQAAQEDRLGRQILLNVDLWVSRFARVCAIGFIGRASLTSTDVSDADIFARLSAIYDQFLFG